MGIYGEIDDNLWETRRVEIYEDGSYRYTDGKEKVGDIYLAERVSPFARPLF